MAWSWSSAHTAGGGSPWDTKFPILLLQNSRFQSKRARDGVFGKMAEFIAWELKVLESGVMPDTGFDGEPFDARSFRGELAGTPIAEGFYAAFAGIKGDRKSRKENHRFKRCWNSTFICDRCLAAQPFKHGLEELSYGDCCEGALWTRTFLSHELYLAFERFLMHAGLRQTNSRSPGSTGRPRNKKRWCKRARFAPDRYHSHHVDLRQGTSDPRIPEVDRELGVLACNCGRPKIAYRDNFLEIHH